MRSIRGFSCVCAAAIGALTLVGSPNGAGAVATGCSPGYSTPGPQTLESALLLPRTAAGIQAGEFTEQTIADVFAIVDANEDGVICFKDISKLRGNSTKYWGYYYEAFDNYHPVK